MPAETYTDQKAGDDKSSTSKKRRARQACLLCRTRKVRCDVTIQSPCSNCRWSGNDCVVTERLEWLKRKRPLSQLKQYPELKSAIALSMSHSTASDASDSQNISAAIQAQDCRTSVQPAGTEEDDTHHVQNHTSPCSASLASATPSAQDLFAKGITKSVIPAALGDSQSMTLPAFIGPLSSRLTTQDISYLQAKGALSVPPPECRESLIWCFFEYVYPFMPVVDLDEIVHAMQGPYTPNGGISLLLLQAILFAGTAFVPLHHIHAMGIATRQECRELFFRRVLLLYNVDVETDRLVLAQALLLMTLWYESPKTLKGTSYWIEVAISQCFAAGLHYDPSASQRPLSLQLSKLRRRIWWTCFMRDRVVSLGMQRHSRIDRNDFTVSMLDYSDFEPPIRPPWRTKVYAKFCSYAHDSVKFQQLSQLCIMKAKLCCCLPQCMRTPHGIFSSPAAGLFTSGFYTGLPGMQRTSDFIECNEELLRWRDCLPERIGPMPSLPNNAPAPLDSTIVLNRMLLEMVYLEAVTTLHSARLIEMDRLGAGASYVDWETSNLYREDAASRISAMATEIHASGLDTMLPTMAIGVLVSAASVHLQVLKTNKRADRQKTREGFRACMDVIDSLKDMYVIATVAKDAMEWEFLEQPRSRNLSGPNTIVGSLTTSQDCPILEAAGVATVSTAPDDPGTVQGSLSQLGIELDSNSDILFDDPLRNPWQDFEAFENTLMFCDIKT